MIPVYVFGIDGTLADCSRREIFEMKRPCIVVAGFGRCGSSMLMQMLARGGVKCLGRAPGYEDARASIDDFAPEWFAGLSNCAVKVLSPEKCRIADMPNHIVVWLDRDSDEQAKSMIKFLNFFGAPVWSNRVVRKTLAASIKRDRATARAKIGGGGGTDFLTLRFETVLADPIAAATRIVEFLARHGYALDAQRMAAAVKQRSPKCLPGAEDLIA